MTVTDFDISNSTRAYAVANTPLYLLRMLKEDPVVREIALKLPLDQILNELKAIVDKPESTSEEGVLPYLLLTALSFLPQAEGLQRAATFSAPQFNWYIPILNELSRAFNPIQVFELNSAPRLSEPFLIAESRAPTDTKLIIS